MARAAWLDGEQSPLSKAALTYPFYLEKVSNVSLKDWEGEGIWVVFERPKPPLGSATVGEGGREGSYRPINDKQQERQLFTSGILRQLGFKSWLHHILAMSLRSNHLTSLCL